MRKIEINRLRQRYDKMRRLCRETNRKRRHLRQQVDLLCRDLVQGNLSLAASLSDWQRINDFQGALVGEFDLTYLLHKALRLIRAEYPGSNAAIYLCGDTTPAAHLTGAWEEASADIQELETTLRQTAVRLTLEQQAPLVIADGGSWPEITVRQRGQLAGLSLISLPLAGPDETLGAVIIYRQLSQKLHARDQKKILPMLKPLGRAVAALQRLQQLIS